MRGWRVEGCVVRVKGVGGEGVEGWMVSIKGVGGER